MGRTGTDEWQYNKRWRTAEEEHAHAVAALLVAATLVPEHKWREPLSPRRWSPAQLLLHVAEAHAIGLDAPRASGIASATTSASKRGWFTRYVVLPLARRLGRVPRRVLAQTAPDTSRAHAHTRDALAARVQAAAVTLRTVLRAQAPQLGTRLQHPVFGPIEPSELLRLLSALTREHARALAPPRPARGDFKCLPDLSEAGT